MDLTIPNLLDVIEQQNVPFTTPILHERYFPEHTSKSVGAMLGYLCSREIIQRIGEQGKHRAKLFWPTEGRSVKGLHAAYIEASTKGRVIARRANAEKLLGLQELVEAQENNFLLGAVWTRPVKNFVRFFPV